MSNPFLRHGVPWAAMIALVGCSSSTTSNGMGPGTDAAPAANDATDGSNTGPTNDGSTAESAVNQADDGSAGFGFPVSNVSAAPVAAAGVAGDLDVAQNCSLDATKGTFASPCASLTAMVRFAKSTGPMGSVGVVHVHSLTVEANARLSITGLLPAIIVADDQVNVLGEVSVSAVSGVPGAGGGAADTSTGKGSGPGAGATAPGKGTGGGSFCGAGGPGGDGIADAGADAGGAGRPGATYGIAALIPLVGGSSGAGNSTANSSVGGGGGGALQISARNAISVTGFVGAGGGGGGGHANTSGGSGGAILLEAAMVTVSGTLAANGGGGGPAGHDATNDAQPAAGGLLTLSTGTQIGGQGSAAGAINGAPGGFTGGGGGGAGWIRINTSTGNANLAGATISPSLGSGCASQGTL